jgi:hypothetical protein
MNIFFLSENPQLAAAYQHDKHVVKMITETCQLLSTWYHNNSFAGFGSTPWYKATHQKHPCALWLLESRHNVLWLTRHLRALINEYDMRFQTKGKFENARKILRTVEAILMVFLVEGDMTLPPQVVPDDYKTDGNTFHDTVIAYRAYYMGEKLSSARYTGTSEPDWMELLLENPLP